MMTLFAIVYFPSNDSLNCIYYLQDLTIDGIVVEIWAPK